MKTSKQFRRVFMRILSAALAVLCSGLVSLGAMAAPLELTEVLQAVESEELAFYSLQDIPNNIQTVLSLGQREQLVQTDGLYELRVENEDGSGRVEVYQAPVKFVDDDGEVQLIDTGMRTLNSLTRLFFGYAYQNASAAFSIKYSENPTDGWLFDDVFTLATVTQGAVENGVVSHTADGDGQIFYESAFGAGTSLLQTNITTGMRQRLTVDSAEAAQDIRYRFHSNWYKPVLRADGKTVDIVRKNNPAEVIYTLSSVYLYDTYTPTDAEDVAQHFDDTYSEYTLTALDQNTWDIGVSLSPAFLESEDTVYPVTAELYTVSAATYTGALEDTYISETSAAGAYANSTELVFGNIGGVAYRTYIQFPNFPTGVGQNRDILSATLTLTLQENQVWNWSVTAYGLFGEWSPETLQWDNQPEYYNLGVMGDYTPQDCSLAIEEVVHDWHQENMANYGLLITYTNQPATYNSVYSSRAGAGLGPTLTFAYSEPYGEVSMFADDEIGASYYIRNLNSLTYMTVDEEGIACINDILPSSEGQRWYIEYVDNGFYELVRVDGWSGVLDVHNAGDFDGSRLKTFTSTGNHAQQFRIIDCGNDTYRLQPRISMNRVVDVLTAEIDDGTYLHLWEYIGAPQQQWMFEKSTPYGSAGDYWEITAGSIYRRPVNCFGYALGLTYRVDWHLEEGSASTADEAFSELEYFVDWELSELMSGRGWIGSSVTIRRLSSGTAPIRENEYRAAVRLTECTYPTGNQWFHSYHFVVQSSNGGWASKFGSDPSISLGKISDQQLFNHSIWEQQDTGAYKGDWGYMDYIVYFAIEKSYRDTEGVDHE